MTQFAATDAPASPLHLRVRDERFPLEKSFVTAHGSKDAAHVVVVELNDGTSLGRGECVPYPRYDETVEGVIEQIRQVAPAIETGVLTRLTLAQAMPPGAARNAIDLAFWDLEAKRSGRSVWEMTGLAVPRDMVTAYTISLDTPDAMGAEASLQAHRPLLKLKLGAAGDLDRLAAVRRAAPNARLVIDANEGWTEQDLRRYLPALQQAGVELLEQPLPAGRDQVLAEIPHLVPICADESCHVPEDLKRIGHCYDAVNVKLDKSGGLTTALELTELAIARGMQVMAGCMVASSLAIAPALLIASRAKWVDLDAPLLLKQDRPWGMRFDGSRILPGDARLWG